MEVAGFVETSLCVFQQKEVTFQKTVIFGLTNTTPFRIQG